MLSIPPDVLHHDILEFFSVNDLHHLRFLSRRFYSIYQRHLVDESKDHQPYLRCIEEDNADLFSELFRIQPKIPFREYDLIALASNSKAFKICLMFCLMKNPNNLHALRQGSVLIFLQLLEKLHPDYHPDIKYKFNPTLEDYIDLIENGMLVRYLDFTRVSLKRIDHSTLHHKGLIELAIKKTKKHNLTPILNRYIPPNSGIRYGEKSPPDIIVDKIYSIGKYRAYLRWLKDNQDVLELRTHHVFSYILRDYITLNKGVTFDLSDILQSDKYIPDLFFHPYIGEEELEIIDKSLTDENTLRRLLDHIADREVGNDQIKSECPHERDKILSRSTLSKVENLDMFTYLLLCYDIDIREEGIQVPDDIYQRARERYLPKVERRV